MRCMGNKNNPAVVLLHGLGYDAQIWDDWCDDLSARYYVMAPDLLGYGENKAVPSLSLEEDALTLLKSLPATAFYVGWSLGGLFALWLATHRPKRVLGAMTMCTTPCFTMRDDWSAGVPNAELDKFKAIATDGDSATINRRLSNLSVRGESNPEPWLEKLTNLKGSADRVSIRAGVSILRLADLRADLAQCATPIRYCLGGMDVMLPATLATALTDLNLQHKVLLWQEASHILPWSQKQAVQQALYDFIEEVL